MPGVLNRRKRPSHAISDDDEESDGSRSSSGSKRARHNASNRRAAANGYHDDEYVEDAHQPGSIVRVKLINFVTYTAAEFHLGPSLNMIIGPNGTGKSTLVCAICLGLGWSPQNLGRAKELGEFVKHGNPEAEIEIELAAGEGQTSNPVIRRIIKKEGNKSTFFVNGRPTPQKDVVALAKKFSIQIDNLCQFLPQDRVADFARLDPVSLLRETQRAAAPEQMVQWHDELKQLRLDEKTLEGRKQDDESRLKTLQAKQNATREDVERWNQRQDLIVKSRALEKCRPMINMTILKAEVNQIKQDIRANTRELEQFTAEVEPARRAQQEMELYRDQVSEVVGSRKGRFDAIKGSMDQIVTKIDAEEKSMANFSADIEAEKHAERQRKTDTKRVEAEIARLTRAKDENPVEYDPTAFETRKAEYRRKLNEAERRRVEISNEMTGFREQAPVIRAKLAQKVSERGQLDTQSGQQANLLKKLSKDTWTGWHWLEKNMATLPLKDTVYPPPILSCTVQDSQYADAVEGQLRLGDLTAITCLNGDDAKIVSDKLLGLAGLGLHQITIRTAPKPLNFYQSPATREELQRFGFDGWILDYIQGPEPVLAMLCDSAKLHRSAYSSRPISNEQHAALQDQHSKITKWVSGTEVCQITRRREYGPGATSTSVQQLRKAQYFTDQPVDTEEKRRLDEDIRDLQHEMEGLKALHQEKKELCEQAIRERNEAAKQRDDVQAEQDGLSKAYAEWEGLPRKIASKEAELEGIHELSRETVDKIRSIQARSEQASLKIATLTLAYARTVTQLRVAHESLVEAEIRLIEANSEVDAFKADNAHIQQTLDQKKAEIQRLESAKKTASTEYRKYFAAATRIVEQLTEAEDAIVKEYKELPSVQDLDNEIAAVTSRLSLMSEGNPNAIKAFEERELQIEKAEERLATMAHELETIRESIRAIREQWEPELDRLVAKISDGFSYNFQQIGCAGQVGVYKDEDFENWSIQIQVRFRENESLSILDSHRQSGGERAVSTIFYLMALQDLARSPFRVVDEINQGMDPRNERMVHERMVNIACRERTSQYFLITPKLLNDLKFHPKMKVHCIASGEHMPDTSVNLDLQKLAKVALRVRKQGMALQRG